MQPKTLLLQAWIGNQLLHLWCGVQRIMFCSKQLFFYKNLVFQVVKKIASCGNLLCWFHQMYGCGLAMNLTTI
jgi:hypothetical protein